MDQSGRNDRCPCGSGKKYKKCCGSRAEAITGFTQQERMSALAKLGLLVEEAFGYEDDLAFEEFWGPFLDEEDELDDDLSAISTDAFDMWLFFDRPLANGRLVVDVLLENAPLRPGERLYLQQTRATAMRLYRVVALSPGLSMTLEDALDGGQIIVRERLASRSLCRFDWIAARILPRGASGQPEIERGMLYIPALLGQAVANQLASQREAFRRANPVTPDEAFFKTKGPFFHEVWAQDLLDPALPALHNTDDEPLLATRVHFEVTDRASLEQALDSEAVLERNDVSTWAWSGTNQRGQPIVLGQLRLEDGTLVLETNSDSRGQRGHVLIETVAGSRVRHTATTHEDLERSVREALRASRGRAHPESEDRDEVPLEVAEPLVLNYLARHYRRWLDEPVPALDNHTPRQAAHDARLRPRLALLLDDLQRMYHASLKQGAPAYDPSWMSNELGLEDATAPRHPPPLAHERLAEWMPGLVELSRNVAERLRHQPGFDTSTMLAEEAFNRDLEIQRFLRDSQGDAADAAPSKGAAAATPEFLANHLRWLINFELHRRKTFWVDESLAYLLGHTDVEVSGRELRVPFSSFALVFTDRYTLSLGERMLARDKKCALSGHLLRVITVYVNEQRTDTGRVLEVRFAFDALGADPPHLVLADLPLGADTAINAVLDELAPLPAIEAPMPDANPWRALLQVCVNAILYATSASVEPEARQAPALEGHARPAPPGTPAYSSEQVYFLPGAIEISLVRRFQELERIPDGRQVLRRFMVRGHWRRPAPTWADQRLRWIEPYWKGPDLAATIEQTYRLTP